MQANAKEDDDSFHVNQLKKGNASSFNFLFHQYEAKLYHICLYLTHSPSDAEEVVQEVFVKIWETRHRLDPELSFSAYLIQIAKNHIYNKASRRLREHAFQTYYTHTQSAFDNSTQEELNHWSTEKIITQLIDSLPFMQKKVFTLSRFQGLSNQEIANHLQLSISTVENHIHLALKTLKKHLVKEHLYFALWMLEMLQ
ncbi:RNA polymerase sigma-70 factor (ECF subfamily) [Catalinimonas alkaloidigena]|uniref:RNA polymerase sigma factor n=1 Tax=Catalinimonas alkaloidigena TaxID=1075417 RepID=UPI0024065D6C|nr:RNA polymerase sigma-70 factor [Catalinimonas alkaloidigena]MDF9799622.1 RNA polymerase sigma-70 factor (ECF subfamily) [Catalinimonas alkaloidigena]